MKRKEKESTDFVDKKWAIAGIENSTFGSEG